MPLFRGSKNATIVNGEIVATAQDIADAVKDAIAAKNAAENAEQGAIDNLEQFDDRYLGAKSSDPSVDNDGDPLVDGALYYNTTETATKVYDSDSDTWINLKLSDQDQANIDTVANIATQVETVSDNISDVQDVATNLSGSDTIGTVASSINNVDLVSENITDVETVSTNLSGPDTIGTVAGSISDVQTVSTNIADVNTAADNITAIQDAPQFASDAEDAQGYAEEWAITEEDTPVSEDAGGDGTNDFSALHHAAKASASASAASTSESNALTSEQNAATSESNALTSEQNAADSEQEASDSAEAAATSESNALTSESNAATSESNALDSANDAQTAETGAVDAQSYAEEWANAPEDTLISSDAGGDGSDDFSALHHANKAASSASAASTSEDNAASSESNASTSEQNAADSASEALTSEQNAAQSESNAATSEQNAQQAATDAETALDTFTDQYLGAKSSDPATDNDGDPLQDGALYFNTSDNSLKIYSDSLSDWVVVEIRSHSEIRNLFSAGGDLTYNSTTGEFSVTTYKSGDFDIDFSGKDTDDLSEGTSNLYYTDARVDSHLSGGTGVSYSSGTISIGQSVGTSDNVEFNDVVVAGDLTVSGTTTTVNTETLDVADNNITLNSNYDGSSPTENGGITINRGSESDVVLQWNETDDHWEIESGGTTGRILTTGDEGLGNGLDADLLDGEQGSYYLNYNNFTNTPTIGDGTLTVEGGSGLSGSGTFDANATSNNSITIDHADTSSQGSVNNSGSTIIQDVTLDGFGHVTNLNSKNLSASDVGALGVNDKADDADKLDGLNSSQFLRSDADNSYIDFSNNEQPDYYVDGRLYWDLSAGLYIKSSNANSSSPRLLWSGANVSSGGGIDISYGNEDYPTIAHSDTSSQGSVNNSGDTVIQDISVDGFGHITNINSTTINAGGPPVGATYIQFPGESSPSSLYGGSWSAIFDNEGVFFRTPGNDASNFGGGVQLDQMQDHKHQSYIRGEGGFSYGHGTITSTGNPTKNGVDFRASVTDKNITSTNPLTGPLSESGSQYRAGSETRPRNRTIRVWKRTG